MHCGRVFASASCDVCLSRRRLRCCACSVWVALRPGPRTSELRCASFCAVELLWTWFVYGCTAAEFASAGCAVCLSGRRLSCCGCSVCTGAWWPWFASVSALCVFLENAECCACSVWVALRPILASASCVVSLSGGRLSRCGCSLCTGDTVAEFSHQRVALCVFVEGV